MLDFLRNTVLIFLIFLPAPYTEGSTPPSVYIVRFFVIFFLFLSLARLYVLKKGFVDPGDQRLIRIPLILFFAFVLYFVARITFVGGDYWQVSELLFCPLFFLVCLDFFSGKKEIGMVTFLIGVEIVALALMGTYWRLNLVEEYQRWYAPYKVKGSLAGYSQGIFLYDKTFWIFVAMASSLFAGYLIYWFKRDQSGKRYRAHSFEFIFFITLLLGAAIFFIQVKAYAAFIVELLIVALCLGTGLFSRLKHQLLFFGLVAIFSGLSIFFLFMANPAIYEQFNAFVSTNTLQHRENNRVCFSAFLTHPIFGAGVKTCVGNVSVGPNDYLKLLAETGIVGCLLFFVPILILVFNGLNTCLTNPSLWCRIMGKVSFIGILSFAILLYCSPIFKTSAMMALFVLYLVILQRCSTMYRTKDEESLTTE